MDVEGDSDGAIGLAIQQSEKNVVAGYQVDPVPFAFDFASAR
jgi:hypothetical protein